MILFHTANKIADVCVCVGMCVYVCVCILGMCGYVWVCVGMRGYV